MTLATYTLRAALSFAVLATAFPLAAQTCHPNIRETTPASQFIVDAKKDTVLDKKTGLMWKRCAEGQSGSDCAAGAYSSLDWSGALSLAAESRHAGYQDWRLPNSKELESLVEEKCYGPAINLSAFPNAPSDGYWSSSPYVYHSDYAWYVGFNGGGSGYGGRGNGHAARLVRGGQ